WVGSADFFGPREGQNDGVTARRQPGSAVKPFTYATAFDQDLTPADLIEDRPVDFGLQRGVYSPVNYDRSFRGEVPARLALASSLNVPAVNVLARTGVQNVLGKMRQAGLESLDQDPDFYGLGLTLGCGEVSLLELANAYATLAAGGVYRPPAMILPDEREEPEGRRVFSEQAAYLVTDILSDDAARATGFGRDSLLALPFPVAAKTGTSKNFRDNWTVGYTSEVVVAVWAGNFDARPMGHVSGISGAGPLWREAMLLVAEQYPPGFFRRPRGIVERQVCADTGLLAGPDCPNRRTELFIEGRLPGGFCPAHRRPNQAEARPTGARSKLAILNPRPGERYLFDPGIETGFQNLSLEARSQPGLEWFIWYVNGAEAGRIRADGARAPALLYPLRRGRLTIELKGVTSGRQVASARVSIEVH
ncbi:MAG: penicillin-binding transpeptidase domain-containing protein, partial [Thermodesulfobacteriota bacterium]